MLAGEVVEWPRVNRRSMFGTTKSRNAPHVARLPGIGISQPGRRPGLDAAPGGPAAGASPLGLGASPGDVGARGRLAFPPPLLPGRSRAARPTLARAARAGARRAEASPGCEAAGC